MTTGTGVTLMELASVGWLAAASTADGTPVRAE